ncbi:hypothetical protein Q0Z83_018950 [Actinoplanes sichuanensis]|nr:hypothetical protein Q0Z83_018950 [Actinoplanes sichuanensis]
MLALTGEGGTILMPAVGLDPADLASIRLWFEMGEPAPSTQAEELAIGALHGIVRAAVGPDWQPLSGWNCRGSPARRAPPAGFSGASWRTSRCPRRPTPSPWC